MAIAIPPEADTLTTPDLILTPDRPIMVVGGTFQGTSAQLTIWAKAYNKEITAKHTPRYAAKKAARALLLTSSMHDLARLGYYDDPGNTYGDPPGFGFNPGQLFPLPTGGPIPSDVFTGLQLAISIISEIPSGYAQILAAVLEVIELILDIVNWIASLFAGKPTYIDTQIVATRFLSGLNPASFVAGTRLLRNMSQNGIYLSSSDPAAQQVLADIRTQAELMIWSQGELTYDEGKQLIDLVWGSANDSSFVLPEYLKKPPPSQQPPPPPPPTCPPGYTYDPTTNQCVPNNQPPPPPGQPPCPPYTQLPNCLPTAPAADPSNDTPADLMQALTYWLSIIAIYLMNLFQAIAFAPSGGGDGAGNSDPVTCKQLTGLVGNVTGELAAIATAITDAAPTGGGGQPVDLSHINAWADQETSDETAVTSNLATLDAQLAADLAAKLQTS